MKYYLLSFIFGMVMYNFIPKDIAIADSKVPSIDEATLSVLEDNAHCYKMTTRSVGKNLLPEVKIICK